ncbi:MAG: ABC transporter substrate-binding protein [Candidatus Rokuibacteriota bacterium]
MRQSMRFAMVLALVAALLGAPTAWAAPIVFGTAAQKEFDNMPFLIAKEKGLFEQEGVQVELFHFKGGGEFVSGFATGKVHLGFTSFASALRGMVRGVPIRIVAQTSHFPVFWGLMVRPDSPIKTIKDLKPGARISITTEGGLTHYVALLMLQQAGLDVGQATLVPLGAGPQMPAALRAGQIDAAVVWSPVGPELQRAGAGRYVAKLTDMLPAFTFSGVVASQDFIQKDPESIRKILRAYRKGLAWMREHPDETVKLMAQWYDMEPAIAQDVYKESIRNFTDDGRIDLKGLEFVIDTSVKFKFLDKPLSVENAADTRFVPIK